MDDGPSKQALLDTPVTGAGELAAMMVDLEDEIEELRIAFRSS